MPAGRPRNFDLDNALEKAMLVFWKKGYEGTSIPDLTEAMGINRPSLYAAFGNKEELFLKVLDKYRAEPAAYLMKALERPTAREAFQALIDGAIDLQTGPSNPAGCLYVHGALVASDASEAVRRELVTRRGAAENAIRERFEKAVSDGDLPPETDPADLAKFTIMVLHGLAVQAAGGDPQASLKRAAHVALGAFPSKGTNS